MKLLLHFTLFVLCSSLIVASAFGQLTASRDGKLDREFGDNGSLIVQTGRGVTFFGDSILLADGKIAWVNTFQDQAGHFHISVSKLLSNGQPDPSFGENGTAYFSFGINDIGLSIAKLANGDLIVAGHTAASSNSAKYDFLVFRITANGELDSTFGTNGSFTRDFAEAGSAEFSDDTASSLLLLPKGKILVGGVSNRYSSPAARGNTSSTLIRLNADGSIDDTFGQGGVSHLSIGNDSVGSSFARHAVVLARYADGKILVGSNTEEQTATEYRTHGEIYRFQENGALDTKFAQNGRLVLSYPNTFTACNGIKILPGGSFLVLMPYALLKFTNSGSYESDFGDAGIRLLGAYVLDLLISDDQKILISGIEVINFSPLPGNRQIGRVLRTFSNGMPDQRFGTLGKTRVTFQDPNVGPGTSFIGLGRIHLVDSKHVIVTGVYNAGSNWGLMMLTKIVISK